MNALHDETCDCLECFNAMKANTYEMHYAKHAYMYPDYAESKPEEFHDGELKALVPVKVYSRPDGNLIKTVPKGGIVGTIYSHKVHNGVVWWQLTDNYFVKHGTGIFDKNHLMETIAGTRAKKQAEIDAAVKKRQDANTNPLYRAGKDWETILPDWGSLKIWLIAIGILLALLILAYIVRAFK